MKLICYLVLILLLPVCCLAQFSISGKILNQADTKPMANASVFLSNATIGDITNTNGTFTLSNIKPGKYTLVVSMVGFESYSQSVLISDSNLVLPGIFIFPKTILLNEVKIRPTDDPLRERNYAWFKEQFLGTSELSKECRILNPEILDLNYDEATNELTASSQDFLEIENDALGYRIKYLLSSFTMNNKEMGAITFNYQGYALFNDMKGTDAQQKSWQKKREQVYEGSAMHFFRLALNNSIEDEGFRVLQIAKYRNPDRPPEKVIKAKIIEFNGDTHHRDSLSYWKKKSKLAVTLQRLMHFPLNKTDFVGETKQPGIHTFGCENDDLYITYKKNHHFPLNSSLAHINYPGNTEATIVSFNGPVVLFDNNGVVNNPASLTYSGLWVRNRVEALLPVDYEPAQNKTAVPGDTSILKNIFSKLKIYAADHITEKVYLHLDRPRYTVGDTIWFKAYTVTGQQHQLSTQSGVLYVELIGPNDTVIRRKLLHLESGIAWGSMTLQSKFKAGIYHLRAYTNWMRNAGPEYFYDQKLQIAGDVLSPAITTGKQPVQINPDVQFFPEGGDLVNGIRSRVAIKAVNIDGTGADVKGEIEDNSGNVVTGFVTLHLGMGVFALTPESGKTYKANIFTEGGARFTIDLPVALAKGYTLALNNNGADSIFLKVAVNPALFQKKKNTEFYVLGQVGENIYYSAFGKLDGLVYTSMIDKGIFPSGIVKFTLFSESGEPLNERIAFIQNNDTLNFKADSLKGAYTTRQKVSIGFEVKNAAGKPVTGAFSAAVINESRLGADETAESTMMNNLLLTSDLKGTIERPDYYFTNVNEQTRAGLDMLMLTQGYRRFAWEQVLNGTNPPVTYPPEKLPGLTGTVKTPGGKPVSKGKISLMAIRQGLIIDTITDAEGNFKFTGIDLPDTAKILLTAGKANKSNNVVITVNPANYPPVKQYNEVPPVPLKIPGALKSYAANQLQGPLIYNEKGRNFIEMRKLQGYPSVKDALTAMPDTLLKSFQDDSRQNIFIDGMPFKFNTLYAYLPEEIKSIEILKNQPGAPFLVIKTKRISGGDTIILKKVTIPGQRIHKEEQVTHSDNLNGPGNANQVIMGDKLEGCPVISQCLTGKILGVTIIPGIGIDPKPIITSDRRPGAPTMALIVDGLIMDSSHLDELDANNISSIEVLRSGAYLAIYGTEASGGALVVTTKNAGDAKPIDNGPRGLITYPFKGFYKAREFYSPKYDNPKTGSIAPDLRSTIYWKPNIITDKDGKATFEYFNADTKGTYRIVIEGIDTDGNLGRLVYRYKVE